MSTPVEEIARQHEEARSLLVSMVCAKPSSHSEIPLTMKTRPTVDIFMPSKEKENQEEKKMLDKGNTSDDDVTNVDPAQDGNEAQSYPDIITWTSRGQIDVTKLQELVREGYRISEHTPPPSIKTSPDSRPKSTATPKPTTATTSSKNSNTDNKQKTSSKHLATKKNTPNQIKSTTNLWDPINASIHNVNIVRPSHDAWGIGKIVLIFADDFLQKHFEMPWWHLRSDIRDAVQPVLDVLQVTPDRVIRLLLASLPPGQTIPLHHDSGAWVHQTHRVHVPIIAEHPNEIMFRVGKTDEQLERIDCTPGHLFEMNNQCRHAVSNCSSDYRVHLILDYQDEPVKNRILLNPGERLLQTRRSVDRLVDQGSRPTPSFLILGAQKAGTTSLYEYMMQHPLIVRPKRRETHCLDWRWKEELEPNKTFTTKQLRQHCFLFYEEEALRLRPSCCTGDSTPSYLLDSRRVIPRLKQVFDWRVQFLVMTRDPIQRAESHYAMVTSPHGTPAQIKTRGKEWRSKSFEEVVKQELRDMKACGLVPYWDIDTGNFDKVVFDSFINTDAEDSAWNLYLENHVPLNTGSYGLLARGLYALNLLPWLAAFDKDQFLVLELESDLASDRVHDTMQRVFDHVGVISSGFELTDASPQNTREYQPKMNAELLQYMERFFAPQNERFQKLLQTMK